MVRVFLIWVLISVGFIRAETNYDEALPEKSRELLEKLEKYSKDQRAETQARILNQKQETLEALQRQLADQLKLGNQKEVLALSQLLEYLKRGQSLEALAIRSDENLGPPMSKITIKVLVDATSEMRIQGRDLWMDHNDGGGSRPGMHQGVFPTTVNGVEWMPTWIDLVTDKFDLRNAAFPSEGSANVHISQIDGRGSVEVKEEPSEANDHTLVLALKDGGSGSDWLEFRITW